MADISQLADLLPVVAETLKPYQEEFARFDRLPAEGLSRTGRRWRSSSVCRHVSRRAGVRATSRAPSTMGTRNTVHS